jgi:hypothetical protein
MTDAEREGVRKDTIEECAKLVERIVYGLECYDAIDEYREAQILKPLADKIRALADRR